mgnify:CR=1 FL=1
MVARKPKNKRYPRGKVGERAYAVGDIHGCLNETLTLLQQLKTDNDYRDEAITYMIFLGDIVDRGPDSKKIVELLMDFPYEFAEPLFIKGNHEEMMVRGLTNEPELLQQWLKFGGFECAESYGLRRDQLSGQSPWVVQQMLRSVVPKEHVDFLDGFLDYVQFGDFLFTHAGLRPGVALSQQNPRDMRWIRDAFLEFDGEFELMVVHGHTISDEIEIRHNRIGLDTGAYETGRLSAICIEDHQTKYFCSKSNDI